MWLPSIFHDMSQDTTPATQLAPCHHFGQRWQCDSQKTRNMTRLKYCACHAKWHWRSGKWCTCHEKCNASSENVAQALRLPRKATFDTSWNMLECHEVPRLPRETTLREAGKLEIGHLLQNFYHRHGHIVLARTVANGCGRLRTVADVIATSGEHSSIPTPLEWNGNPCYAFGKKCKWWVHNGA